MNADATPARIRPLAEQPALAERAADLLRTPQALRQLSPDDAQLIVQRMGLVGLPAGAVVLREGDQTAAPFLLLLLEGEVEVDTRAGGAADAVALAVLGPGSIIGEMSLLDHAPRSATCTALSPVLAAGLSRRALEQLLDEHPRAAARLLLGLAQRLAERLRALGQQVQVYAELAAVRR